ncbi:hypothetical protein [Methylotetracoccus oryzae]|uniref:hypothetical protein n=1 Tax=Methylotetracoccus oryzae TaxID=1919059 RepID=UPI001118E595|nr:hypothetical protein [Methylotetracoccus oryzae]
MKVSIVAAAVLVIGAAPAALATTPSEREYQRGYNDCLKGRYDQNQHGDSYKKGCRAAEDHEKPTYPTATQSAATKDHASKAKISDLKGVNSIKSFDMMTAKGFKNVDTITQGDTLYGIYYNAKTHQCVQLTNAKNHVVSADDIGTHPKCK